MKPGHELDALVAERVMGLEVVSNAERYLEIQSAGGDFFGKKHVATVITHNETFARHRPGRTLATVPAYSTHIAAAWEVVEKLMHLHPHLSYCDTTGNWTFEFTKANTEISGVSEPGDSPATAPHAICLAALEACGVDLSANRG